MLQKNIKGTMDIETNQRLDSKTIRLHPRKPVAQLHYETENELFGHTKRHDSLEREIFEGIIGGRRGRGRPQRRWSQDITDRISMN